VSWTAVEYSFGEKQQNAACAATGGQNSAHLRFAIEAGRIGIWELDLASGVVSGSPTYMANLGLPPDASITWNDVSQLVHADDRARWLEAVAHAMAGLGDLDIEYRVTRPGGALGWLHVRAQPVAGPGGAPVSLAGITFDTTERRRAELRLELSEESLRLAADAAEVGTWDLDLTTNVLTWSDRTRAMFGISPGVPCSMADFYGGLHPQDLEETSAAFAAALDPAIRAVYDVEYRTIGREDGVVRWIAAKGRGLFEGDVCRRAIGTAIDISARKRAALRQEFLLDLLDRLRTMNDPAAILETAVRALGRQLGACRVGYSKVQPDGVNIDIETCYVDGVATLTGLFELDSFGAHNIARQRQGRTVVVPDIAADALGDPATWARIDTRAYLSVPLLRDGALRATLFVNHRDPHAWSDGEVRLIEDVAGRIWDSLERARAEDELRRLNASLESEVAKRSEELNRTWRLAPVVMVVGGPDGTLLQANAAWTATLGWSEAETIGRDVMEFVAPEGREAGQAGMERLFAGTPVIEYQIPFLTRTGERRRIAWTTVPEGGRLYGYGRDVTDLLIAEERLLQAQKMEAVGQLTGGLAHDFNNLLTGITGGLEFLQRRIAQGRVADLDRYITPAQQAAQRAAALTQRLLAFSRRQTLDPKPTDINHLVQGMEDIVRRTAGPHLRVAVHLAEAPWSTLVDPNQLENALLNLCINARDAMPDGGDLTIATAHHVMDAAAAAAHDLPAGDYVSLCVADTGTGMTQDVIRRAFDPFFTTKPLGAGTGLGLSMVYGFARQSGGQVRILSELGQGTQVCIYLPRHAGVARSHGEAQAGRGVVDAAHGETVLVVDDEGAVRMLITDVLAEMGYRVLEAADSAEGTNFLASARQIDLLVTDVGLPGGLNGRQLADLARRNRPGLPVLFITGYAETSAMGTGQLESGMSVLAKPFQLEMLAERVRCILEK
jgi:PAS domain S-box-containing protein